MDPVGDEFCIVASQLVPLAFIEKISIRSRREIFLRFAGEKEIDVIVLSAQLDAQLVLESAEAVFGSGKWQLA